MSHYNRPKDNDIFGAGPSQESNPRSRGGVQNKNASSFNIIGFDPSPQVSSKQGDQQSKLEKQNQYRQDLNQMVYDKKNVNEGRGNRGNEYSNEGYSYGDNFGQPQSNTYTTSKKITSYEDDRTISEQEKKKKLQMEIFSANQRAAQDKQTQKKRQSAFESAEDSRRIQDSLNQHDRDDYRQKDSQKRLQEENSRYLNQQRDDFKSKKQSQDMDRLSSQVEGMNFGDPLRERGQPESYSAKNQDVVSDYQKNRDRNRYGNNFNIINNEYNQ